jgi:anti-sigma regulatory factor (Ser/Thr protein kinase)
MMSEHIITLPDQWITADKFEQILRQTSTTTFFKSAGVIFRCTPSCRVMLEAAVRLLSLANQLVAEGIHVSIMFEGKQNKAMGYLNRANFFSLLSEQVQVLPARPDPTYVRHYQGHSKSLVEFTSIGSTYDEQVESIPTQLANALESAMGARPDREQLSRTAFTIFAELIANVYDHSRTSLDGFAALQVYAQGGRVQVVVSDSGIGLLETLRPKLFTQTTTRLTDVELIRALFRGNLAWNRERRGMGLGGCASNALKYKGSVGIRLARCSVHLKPSHGSYETANVQYQQDLVLIKGTHICFSFPLDTSS